MAVVTITGAPFANGYVPTITEWNTSIFGALSASINDINYGQVSASLIDTAVSANSTNKVPRTAAVKTYVDGQINALQIIQEDYRLISGNSDVWGTPNFLLSGASNDFSCVSGLSVVINGTTYTLSSTTYVSGLVLASAGVSATISAGTYAATSGFTKTEGEFGDTVIILDAYNSSFTAATRADTQQAFKTGTEFFLGKVSKKSTAAELGIEKCKRGIGQSARSGLADNDVVYLMEANYIFLNSDMSISATTIPPKYQSTDPASGTSGEYYFNTNSKVWKRYTSSWAQQDAVLLGVIVCDTSGVVAIDHEDYDVAWDSTFECDIYPIMEGTSAISAVSGLSAIGVNVQKVSVAGQSVYMPQPRELVLSAQLLSTLTEASATLYYLYLTPLGEFYFDTVAPRNKGKKKGYYHPKYYWRVISFVWNTSQYNVMPFISKENKYIYMQNGSSGSEVSYGASWLIPYGQTGTAAYTFFESRSTPVFCNIANSLIYINAVSAGVRFKLRNNTLGATLNAGAAESQNEMVLPVQNQTYLAARDSAGAAIIYISQISFEVFL